MHHTSMCIPYTHIICVLNYDVEMLYANRYSAMYSLPGFGASILNYDVIRESILCHVQATGFHARTIIIITNYYYYNY